MRRVGAAEAATCDVTDHGQVDAPPAAADRFGRVGILVNNAGTMADELGHHSGRRVVKAHPWHIRRRPQRSRDVNRSPLILQK